MKIRCPLIMAAVSAMLAQAAQAQVHPEKPTYSAEKCYGVAKAGKNDCFTANNTCGGTAKVDNDPNLWKFVPQGECINMGGTLKKGEKDKES